MRHCAVAVGRNAFWQNNYSCWHCHINRNCVTVGGHIAAVALNELFKKGVFSLCLFSCSNFGFHGFNFKCPNSNVCLSLSSGCLCYGGSNMCVTMCMCVCTDCRLITPVMAGLLQNTEHRLLIDRAPLGFVCSDSRERNQENAPGSKERRE